MGLRLPLWWDVYHKHQHNTGAKLTMSYKGMLLPLCQHWCVNSSGMLPLFIAYFPVTQSFKCLEQKTCEAPREPRACWVVFSAAGEIQRELTERRGWRRENHTCCVQIAVRWWNMSSEGSAYLYSQNVSSFMPWDSTSGWRSSFSFTAHKMKKRYQWFPQETAANEDRCVPWLVTLFEQVWVSVPGSLHLFIERKMSASLRKALFDKAMSNKCFQISSYLCMSYF